MSEETEAAGEVRPEARPEPEYEIDELRQLGQQQLLQLAVQEQAVEAATLRGLSRRELVARLLFDRARRGLSGRERAILQVKPEGFGFLRSPRHDYRNGPDDVYVSPSQIRRLRLRDGDEVVGTTRPPRGEESYLALLHVERVNGLHVQDLFQRIPFSDLTPVRPWRPLRLAGPGGDEVLATLELLAPMALGHRVLIRLPVMFSGLDLFTALGRGALENQPEARLLVLQAGERPEEHAELARRLEDHPRAEVVASSFAEPPAMQAALSRFVLARARRLVETGRDVVLLVDSLTRLVRAHNVEVPHSGKIIGPDLDAAALYEPKALFASARCFEEGGSLTVFATLREDPASRLDQIVGDEFQDRANAEIVLHPELCEEHGHIGLDVLRTRTRAEDNPMGPVSQGQLRKLRHELVGRPPQEALARLRQQVTGRWR